VDHAFPLKEQPRKSEYLLFGCNRGHVDTGRGKGRVPCTVEGWDSTAVSCTRSCGPPATAASGRGQRCQPASSVQGNKQDPAASLPGDVADCACEPGFFLTSDDDDDDGDGDDNKQRALGASQQAVCGADGRWQQQSPCLPVRCDDDEMPAPPKNFDLRRTDSRHQGATNGFEQVKNTYKSSSAVNSSRSPCY